MLDAQQNAMAEKMAKRKQSSSCKEAAIVEQPTANKLSVNVSAAPTPRVSLPIPMIRLVDAQMQTDSPPSDSNQACRCEKSHLKTDTRWVVGKFANVAIGACCCVACFLQEMNCFTSVVSKTQRLNLNPKIVQLLNAET